MDSPVNCVPDPSERPRRTAAYREARRIRIMAMVHCGYSYEMIAREEQISRERVRQIIAKSVEENGKATRPDPNRLQIARLEPALRLAASGIANGNLGAIPHMLRVLDRLDKYGAVVERVENDWVVIHEKLMKKLNHGLRRSERDRNANPGHPSEAVGSGSAEAKNLDSAESGFQAS